ncbi:MAG TPA: hypothetical protein VFX49_19340, partial [Chloroflexota bacterium]|nr:hypothetical protein [Chloroflexota bacterium]
MATAALFLGERVEPLTVERLELPPRAVQAGRIDAGRTLTSLAAALECGDVEALDESLLAPELRSRVALTTLRRRAEKRGRTPALRCAGRELRTLAQAAGWRVEKVVAAPPTAAAVPATAPVPPTSALAPRVDLPRLALKLPV